MHYISSSDIKKKKREEPLPSSANDSWVSSWWTILMIPGVEKKTKVQYCHRCWLWRCFPQYKNRTQRKERFAHLRPGVLHRLPHVLNRRRPLLFIIIFLHLSSSRSLSLHHSSSHLP